MPQVQQLGHKVPYPPDCMTVRVLVNGGRVKVDRRFSLAPLAAPSLLRFMSLRRGGEQMRARTRSCEGEAVALTMQGDSRTGEKWSKGTEIQDCRTVPQAQSCNIAERADPTPILLKYDGDNLNGMKGQGSGVICRIFGRIQKDPHPNLDIIGAL